MLFDLVTKHGQLKERIDVVTHLIQKSTKYKNITLCIMPIYNRKDYCYLSNLGYTSYINQYHDDDSMSILLMYNNHLNTVKYKIDYDYLNTLPENQHVLLLQDTTEFSTLGDKLNWMIDSFNTEIITPTHILPWDDDDIRRNDHIQKTIDYMINDDLSYLNPGNYFFIQKDLCLVEAEPKLTSITTNFIWNHNCHVCHNASGFTYNAYRLAGKYPSSTSNQDQIFDSKLLNLTKNHKDCNVIRLPSRRDNLQEMLAETTYYYLWGFSNFHLSAQSNPQASFDKINEENNRLKNDRYNHTFEEIKIKIQKPIPEKL